MKQQSSIQLLFFSPLQTVFWSCVSLFLVQSSSTEKALANQFLAPGRTPTIANERMPATKTVHMQTKARCTGEMRDELLGTVGWAVELKCRLANMYGRQFTPEIYHTVKTKGNGRTCALFRSQLCPPPANSHLPLVYYLKVEHFTFELMF